LAGRCRAADQCGEEAIDHFKIHRMIVAKAFEHLVQAVKLQSAVPRMDETRVQSEGSAGTTLRRGNTTAILD
jgi:hypothetical protein